MSSIEMSSVYNESDIFSYLDSGINTQQRIENIRKDICRFYPSIHRIAVALYDPERDVLKTYACDEDAVSGFKNYEAVLSKCKSLKDLATNAKKRVVNDILSLNHNDKEHTELIRNAGYQSSLSIPLIIEGKLLGFFFANSRSRGAFTHVLSKHLQMVSMFLTLLLEQDLNKVNTLKSTIESMKVVNQFRDPETAAHLERMANYSLIIARQIAAKFSLSDIQISYLYLYAPLHDVGKIMVPDSILLKDGPLTSDEYKTMKKHSEDGERLIKQMLEVYNLTDVPFVDILIAIVRSHHEKIDGSGYPDGLQGELIPIEARIIAVADIFDALTSERTYKDAWTVDEAFAELRRLSGTKLDSDCVEALICKREEVLSIKQSFIDGTPVQTL